MKKKDFINISIVSILFLANFWVQSRAIGKLVYVFTDEGVYLYASKLISQGLMPYRDFYLNHLPFLMYLNAFILKIVNFNLNIYHLIYILLVFSSVFPIYFIVSKETKSIPAGIFAVILFSTFTEMVQWDGHFFAIRQASLPLLAFALFFISVRRNNIISAIFLSLFSFCILSNTVISVFLIAALLADESLKSKSLKEGFKRLSSMIYIFLILNGLYFTITFLIPNAYEYIVSFQNLRPSIGLSIRFAWLRDSLKNNAPILIFGLLGALFSLRKNLFLSLLTLGTFPIVMLIGKSYFPHYITIFGVCFAVTGGLLLSVIPSKYYTIPLFFLGVILIYFASFKTLKLNLIDAKSPDFFETISKLEQVPEPLLCFEPIYALYSNKNLTSHKYVADMRCLRVLGENLSGNEYLSILQRSNSVLIESFLAQFMPGPAVRYMEQFFKPVYQKGNDRIYIRSTLE